MKKFNHKAALAYADMVNKFIVEEDFDVFELYFDKFMEAYENTDDDDDGICDEFINPSQKLAFDDTPVNKFREEPKPGEIYSDICGNRYFVSAVKELVATVEKPSSVGGTRLVIPCVVLKRLVGKDVADTRVMALREFANASFVKEE